MKKISSFIFILSFIYSCSDTQPVTPDYSGPLFTLLDPATSGVNFVNQVPETPTINILTYQYLHNGAGVSLGDLNNDGLVDIFFAANYGPNMLYLNKGNLKFEEIGQAANIGGKRGWTTGATMVDINNDGFLDIYVSRSGDVDPAARKNAFFINNGNLTFEDKAEALGLADTGYSTQAAFFDYDRDGDLDMYLLNHPISPIQEGDLKTITSQRNENTGDKLYRNDNGKFIDISETAGIIGNSIGYGLSVSTGDINNDGWPDIYVCNDYLERDYLYINNQDGTFKEKAKDATKHISNFSMGSDMADFNNDGFLDLMVVDMVAEDNYRIKTNMSGMNPERFNNAVTNGFHYQYMTNTLQMNNGNETFSEVSKLAGVSNTDWSWTPLFADFDNDGNKDLFITNGLRKEARNNDFVKKKKKLLAELEKNPEQRLTLLRQILDEMPSTKIKNYIFKNEGDISFSNKTKDWGMSDPSFSTGAAYADLDNDGDLDLVVSNIDHPAFVYQNNSEKKNQANFVKVKLKGAPSNVSGVGAAITIKSASGFQKVEHYLNRGYLSSVEDMSHFGLGKDKKIDSLWVQWPDGNLQLQTNIDANKKITIAYKKASNVPVASLYKGTKNNTLFTENALSTTLAYTHKENEYNDFEKEILLPHKMSTLGPAMAVADVNGDGLDDFYVGGAKGYQGYMYVQDASGNFKASNTAIWDKDKNHEDVAAQFFDADGDGDKDLYVVSGGNEYATNDPLLQDRLYVNDGQGNYTKNNNALPTMITSGGCIAVEDYDNDGDLDVFVGGRLIPGQYPKAPRSYLLNNDNGIFKDVTKTLSDQLVAPGLVTTALWEDINNDGNKELLLAGEWMPLMVFEHTNGTFNTISETLGLQNTNGWWNRLASGDFDNDGDIDFIAGNLGDNYKYQATQATPFELYFDDFDNNETGDIVLTYTENGKKVPLRGRECSSQQMPFIKEKFGTYDAFAKANLSDIFGDEKLKNALHLTANTFTSVYIENTGNTSWKITPLPRMAQTSSVNGIVVNDLDLDGNLDVIVSGNLYNAEVETPRNDASNGLVLIGNGKGGFKTLTIKESGYYTPLDVKNIHPITIKGKQNIAVVNNNAALQFYTKK